MARNEVEILFDTISQRHQEGAYQLLTQQAELIRQGDLDMVDALDEAVLQERGRIRYLKS